jgi:hypothetical protein
MTYEYFNAWFILIQLEALGLEVLFEPHALDDL